MIKTLKLITLFILTLGIFVNTGVINTSALWSNPEKVYLCSWNECGLEQWVKLVKESGIDWLDVDWTATDKIQDVIKYLLWFITLIAVIYIIYAWFRILTSSGEDETIKNSKKTIIYVVVWILVIWFAWTIANFAVTIWTSWK
jgi:hypothetical protein